MTNWKEYKLSDLMQIKYGKDHKHLADGSYPLYGSGGIMRYVEKPIYEDESILIPRKGTLSNLFYLNEPFWSVDTMFWSIINKELALPKYLFYTLKTFDLASLNVGSAVPSLTTQVLNEVLVSVPDIDNQTAIAEILSSLDDKIELKNKINQELENLAQTLFKQWFIDFEFPNENGEPYKSSGGEMVESELGEIPKGWEAKNLSEVTEISSSKRIFSKEYVEKGIPFFRGKEITELDNSNKISTELFISNERYNEIKSKFGVPKIGDILITSVGTIGNTYLINYEFDFYFKDGNITWIKNYISHLSPYFIFTWLRSYETQSNIKKVCIGSTQQALTITALNNLKIIFPITVLASEFSSVVESLYNQISSNKNENQELTNLRDTLLPKLISGELEVAEEMAEKA